MRSAAYRANLLKLGVMALLVLAACAAYLLVDVNPKYFDYAMSLRVPKLIVMLIAAFAIGGASLVFQSVINNTIVTPCLLGMNSLYTLIHTAVVFVAGSGSVLAVNANAAFAVDLVIMGLSATVIYGYLFKKTKYNVLYVLLIGTVLTSFFGSIQSTLTRVMDPNEYDSLLSTLVASFSNVNAEIIHFSLVVLALLVFFLRRDLALLDVLTLGKEQAINLGVDYDRSVRRLLLGVTLAIAVATAVVGPISFMGLIIANLSRQLLKTYRHTQLIAGSVLFGMVILVAGQLIVEHVYTYSIPTAGGSSITESSGTSAETPETVTITSLNAEGAETQLEVPYDPQRIAILDMASLDILDALGVGDRVVGTASTSLEYLQEYINEDVANLGTIKEADLEAVMSCEPDVIFIGGRLASSYDALSEIAPVVYLSTDTELGVVESVGKNANTIASLFGLEEEVDSLMADFDSRVAALAEFAEGKTAIVGLVTSGGFNVLGNDGRCSMICREAGFENIGVDAEIDTATHGNEASFEFVVEKDPDYIFVLDRDAAIQTEGAQLAQEIVENELVKGTRAYADGHIVYLSSPAVWYTAEGGITALDVMLRDLESELLSQ